MSARKLIDVVNESGKLAKKTPHRQPMWPAFTNPDAQPGEQGISGGRVLAAPSAISLPHVHAQRTSILYILEGMAATLILVKKRFIPVFHGSGDFVRIHPGLVHCSVNLSGTNCVVAIEFSNEAKFGADVQTRPDLEEMANEVGRQLQQQFLSGKLDLHTEWRPDLTPLYWLHLSSEKR